MRTKEELDRILKKDPKIKADFEAKGVDTVNFAKKLLGQIVFLYFLQKKGWFGVERDADWGEGSKHFLRELLKKTHGDYRNFFNDILEPLFYEALRIDRSHDDDYYSRFDCKIPFLNGGLFDPIGNYDWVHTDIIIPDKLFSNTRKTREGDTGDGILDTFDRYNFTVKEDEPLEKEVAIDPELLGKAYEKFNAIRLDNYDEFKKTLKSGKAGEENKFNKKFGVYYTPREIVHYMCQQSLINYLATELEGKASKEDIETLIHIGEHVSENEARVISEGRETRTYSHKLPENIRKNAALIDQKLADITVCDPAVGSGAFPVGMMSEIVKTRNVLTPFLSLRGAQATKQSQFADNRTVYNFKRRCIEHSLYGVDIDPGAVEIAKLRLWLSLVVDEDDIKNIKPLPNLDYRIMQGNSLISEFMGVNFDADKAKEDGGLFKDEADELIEQFQQKKDEFLNESNVTRKSKLKEEVEYLLVKIFETKLRTQKADYFNRLKNIENKYSVLRNEKQRDKLIEQNKVKLYKESGFNLESVENQLKEFTSGKKIKPFFLWNLYFSEVFHKRGGFDVVIANPPYGAIMSSYFNGVSKGIKINIKEMKDIYKAFFIHSLNNLLKKEGILTFITPNTYYRQKKYIDIRKFLNRFDHKVHINLGDGIFDSVVPTAISIIQNNMKKEYYEYYDLSQEVKLQNNFIELLKNNLSLINQSDINDENNFEIRTPIRINYAEELILDKILECRDAGIQYTSNVKEVKRDKIPHIADRILYSDELYQKQNKKDYDLLIGKNINNYYLDKNCTHFLRINYRDKIMKKYGERVWFSRDILEAKERILWRQTSDKIIAAYDTSGYYFKKSVHCGIIRKEYCESIHYFFLLSLLNSKYLNYLYVKLSNEKGRIFAQIKLNKIRQLPIPDISIKKQQPFISIVDKILSFTQSENYIQTPSKQAKVKALEREIDQLVYKLYDLTPEEIKIVEGENTN